MFGSDFDDVLRFAPERCPAVPHLALRTYTPVLIDAGFPELDIPIPWWEGRTLRFGFPPR